MRHYEHPLVNTASIMNRIASLEAVVAHLTEKLNRVEANVAQVKPSPEVEDLVQKRIADETLSGNIDKVADALESAVVAIRARMEETLRAH